MILTNTKSKFKKIFLSVFSVSLFLYSCNNGNNDDEKNIKTYKLPDSENLTEKENLKYNTRCKEWYDTTLAKTNFNGAILVVKSGNIIYEKYQGVAHLGSNDSINASTPFHIASVGKTFTAMTVLKLWQEKKLELDDLLTKYFPDFNYPGVTIRTLLNHRSGLPNYVNFFDDLKWDKTKMITNQDVYNFLNTRKYEIKKIRKPNTGFKYSNTNYAILALLIEKLTGESYASYLKRNIFDPLEMKNTFVMDDPKKSNISDSYEEDGKLFEINHFDAVYGDKNIYSTVHDLLKWDKFLKSNLLFTKETLDEAYKPYSNEKQSVKNYGLGWRMNVYPDSNKVIFHNGWWHGNNAAFIRLLKEDVTIIITGNRYNKKIYKAKNLINIFSNLYVDNEEE